MNQSTIQKQTPNTESNAGVARGCGGCGDRQRGLMECEVPPSRCRMSRGGERRSPGHMISGTDDMVFSGDRLWPRL